MTYLEVAQTLENFLEGDGDKWDWDNYTLGTTFKDPYLLQLQARMASLGNEYPPVSRDHYCGPEGIVVIRGYIQELRTKERTPLRVFLSLEVRATSFSAVALNGDSGP